MTYKEAIAIIELTKITHWTMWDSEWEAFDIAIEALEKQIPKKANYNYSDEPLCPYCQEVIEDGDAMCESCHQLIDWGGEE